MESRVLDRGDRGDSLALQMINNKYVSLVKNVVQLDKTPWIFFIDQYICLKSRNPFSEKNVYNNLYKNLSSTEVVGKTFFSKYHNETL